MINDKNTLMGCLMLGLLIFPACIITDHCMAVKEHAEADKLASDVMRLMPSLEPDMQDTLMRQLSGKHALYHPKSERERAKAIADVWSLDTGQSLTIAMR